MENNVDRFETIANEVVASTMSKQDKLNAIDWVHRAYLAGMARQAEMLTASMNKVAAQSPLFKGMPK